MNVCSRLEMLINAATLCARERQKIKEALHVVGIDTMDEFMRQLKEYSQATNLHQIGVDFISVGGVGVSPAVITRLEVLLGVGRPRAGSPPDYKSSTNGYP